MSEPEVTIQAAEAPYLGRARRFVALVRKESYQIVRDPSSILIAFVLPIILLFIFGYGVSLDATRTRVGLVVESTTSVGVHGAPQSCLVPAPRTAIARPSAFAPLSFAARPAASLGSRTSGAI